MRHDLAEDTDAAGAVIAIEPILCEAVANPGNSHRTAELPAHAPDQCGDAVPPGKEPRTETENPAGAEHQTRRRWRYGLPLPSGKFERDAGAHRN